MKNWISAAFGVVAGLLGRLIGGFDPPVVLLLALMVVDFVTGLLLAIVWKKSNKSTTGGADSRAMFKGFLKKLLILLLVVLARLMGDAIGEPLIRTVVIWFFVANEGLSLIENLALMGVPFPGFIKNALNVIRETTDKGGDPTGKTGTGTK